MKHRKIKVKLWKCIRNVYKKMLLMFKRLVDLSIVS